jgi:hypothetical protein
MDGLAESNEVYSGAFQEILEKNLYIFYSGCRQADILFSLGEGWERIMNN